MEAFYAPPPPETPELTLDEINEEIRKARQERRERLEREKQEQQEKHNHDLRCNWHKCSCARYITHNVEAMLVPKIRQLNNNFYLYVA